METDCRHIADQNISYDTFRATIDQLTKSFTTIEKKNNILCLVNKYSDVDK